MKKMMMLLLLIGLSGCMRYQPRPYSALMPYGPAQADPTRVAATLADEGAERVTLSEDERVLQELRDLGLSPDEILEMIRSELHRREDARRDSPPDVNESNTEDPKPVEESAIPRTVIVKESGSAPLVIVVPSGKVDAVGSFYRTLAPYGTWIKLSPYGLVWQPTVSALNYSWRPYCDGGRWAWTNQGWCWKSSYSWGWAPFHYGRWVNVARYRWVWVPGTTWSPAWVHWRRSASYFGWAPLPPGAPSRT